MNKALLTLGAAAAIGLLVFLLNHQPPSAIPARPEQKKAQSRPAPARDLAQSSDRDAPPIRSETATFDQLWEQAMAIPDDRRLILAEVERRGGTIKDSFIDEDVASIIRGQFNNSQQAFERTIREQGFTVETFRAKRREDILIMGVKASVTRNVTDPEAKKQAFNQWLNGLHRKAGFGGPGAKSGGADFD